MPNNEKCKICEKEKIECTCNHPPGKSIKNDQNNSGKKNEESPEEKIRRFRLSLLSRSKKSTTPFEFLTKPQTTLKILSFRQIIPQNPKNKNEESDEQGTVASGGV